MQQEANLPSKGGIAGDKNMAVRRQKRSSNRSSASGNGLARSHSWQGFDTAEAKRIVRQQEFWDSGRYADGETVTDTSLPPPPSSPPERLLKKESAEKNRSPKRARHSG